MSHSMGIYPTPCCYIRYENGLLSSLNPFTDLIVSPHSSFASSSVETISDHVLLELTDREERSRVSLISDTLAGRFVIYLRIRLPLSTGLTRQRTCILVKVGIRAKSEVVVTIELRLPFISQAEPREARGSTQTLIVRSKSRRKHRLSFSPQSLRDFYHNVKVLTACLYLRIVFREISREKKRLR